MTSGGIGGNFDLVRKAWLRESRIPQLQPLLAWCVQHRLGYRVVAAAVLGLAATWRTATVTSSANVPPCTTSLRA